MNTYHVYLRKGGMVLVTAAGFTEDKRSKRFYFHSDMKTKDKVTFFSIRDVAGIHSFEITKRPSREEIEAWMRGLPSQDSAQA